MSRDSSQLSTYHVLSANIEIHLAANFGAKQALDWLSSVEYTRAHAHKSPIELFQSGVSQNLTVKNNA